jgi:hypothetical protein
MYAKLDKYPLIEEDMVFQIPVTFNNIPIIKFCITKIFC